MLKPGDLCIVTCRDTRVKRDVNQLITIHDIYIPKNTIVELINFPDPGTGYNAHWFVWVPTLNGFCYWPTGALVKISP